MKTRVFSRFATDYGMLFVLLLLCAYYSWATFAVQHPMGAAGGDALAGQILREFKAGAAVAIVASTSKEDAAFVAALEGRLKQGGLTVATVVQGQPADARRALEEAAQRDVFLEAIACNQTTAGWAVLSEVSARLPALARARIVVPETYRWPNFLRADNLLNVANQIAVIAIVAIGMTAVIITAGIDLSVGSLIALSAVVATLLIQQVAGGLQAGPGAMVWCAAAGIGLCGLMGLVSGMLVAGCGIPAFIATLAMMLVASGLAFIIAKGESVYQVPESFVWLGRGANFGVPNAVWLMLVLYALAHLLMAHTVLGRYIYAVGGNPEAARLSGVPVRRVLLFVYAMCGGLAGLGGVLTASQLKSGAPTYGQMYELYVIAAVVVGGTSLAGGEGKMLGTLIGALIIAVIQNGMNLTNVESYTQKVVLGLVILGAVLLDRFKKHGWNWLARRRPETRP